LAEKESKIRAMFRKRIKPKEKQKEFWVVAEKLPSATPGTFYERVNQTLAEMKFAEEVWAICEPAYAEASKGGQPGIDPVIYFKMLMIGFFEDLPSERAIASRCADSLSVRSFLGYGLTEATPHHGSLGEIRQRLSQEHFRAVHRVMLRALRKHGLLRGRKLGIDSSVIEANASLRALQHRNTEENYWDYVKKLAAAAGVDPEDAKAVRRFDKKRTGRKTSNEDWMNPHDPEAKVGKTKHGATDMIYKPEHVSDLESGAIVEADVRAGDTADTEELTDRVMVAIDTLDQVYQGEVPIEKLGQELAGDEGYFALMEIGALQQAGVRTVIADPHARKRRKDLPAPDRTVLRRATRATRSASGKALLRRRGEHLERGFCHMLDHGGMRRTTLRGQANIAKRYVGAALTFNLSLLMRTLFGIGTPKQWLAKRSQGHLRRTWPPFACLILIARRSLMQIAILETQIANFFLRYLSSRSSLENRGISTGC
jgi:transposase